MSLLRTIRHPTFLRATARNPTTTSPPIAVAGRRFAHQDYGSGDANPKEPNPASHIEHPGPPPPSAAQKGKGQQQQASSGGGDKQSSNNESVSSGAQPKVLNANPPAEGEQSEEVARHNREVSQRYDRAHEKAENEDAEKDKVPKGFWSGK